MIGAWTSDGTLIGEARTRAELYRVCDADSAAYVGPRDWLPDEIAAAITSRGRTEQIVQIAVDAEGETRIDDQISELSNTDLGMLLLLAAQENNERIWQAVKTELSERRGPQTPIDDETRVRTLFSLVSPIDMSSTHIVKKKPADTTGSDLKQAALWAYIILVWIAASHGFWAILNLP